MGSRGMMYGGVVEAYDKSLANVSNMVNCEGPTLGRQMVGEVICRMDGAIVVLLLCRLRWAFVEFKNKDGHLRVSESLVRERKGRRVRMEWWSLRLAAVPFLIWLPYQSNSGV